MLAPVAQLQKVSTKQKNVPSVFICPMFGLGNYMWWQDRQRASLRFDSSCAGFSAYAVAVKTNSGPLSERSRQSYILGQPSSVCKEGQEC
jgi:hypothetical protein